MGYLRDKAPLPGGTESRTGHSHSVAPLVNHLSVAVCLCVCVCVYVSPPTTPPLPSIAKGNPLLQYIISVCYAFFFFFFDN